MSNLISKPGFTDKDTSILNEVAFANKGLYDKPQIALALRGQKLDKVFYNSNGSVNTQVVDQGTALYNNLANNPEYYKDSLSKYTLVETTSTIAAKPGGYTDDSLLYQGEQTYHGFAVTDGVATGFVNRGTGSTTDLTQDGVMALVQTNPPYVSQAKNFMKDVYDQQNITDLDNKPPVTLSESEKNNIYTSGFSLGKTGADSQAMYVLESGKNLMGNISFEGYGTTEVLQRVNAEVYGGEVTFMQLAELELKTKNIVRTNDAVPQNFLSTQFGEVIELNSGFGVIEGFKDLFNGVNLHGIHSHSFNAYNDGGKVIPDQLNTIITQKYLSTLDSQADTLNQQIESLSTTDYAIEYAEYLADKTNSLYFNKDNLFNQVDQIDTLKENFEKVFGGYSNYNGVENVRYSVDNMMIEILDGNPAIQNLLQASS
ncbi:hypothetical protein [Francisella tularensis]|uniref:hypothetical protein n=1 Tax=Francisella tularensis TaxID=263 RepID=UPI001C0F2702|nr:hypothetical protein [Francisella tularensis]MBK2110173.1 hypothetical protein [Francisella tularensis subsp. novicida FSC595]